TGPATELPIAVAGDTLTLLGFDPVEHGPGVLVVGPRRTGRSTALQVLAADAAARGWPVVTITPRPRPLRSESYGGPVFTMDSDRQEVTAALAALVEAGPSLLLVDDLELIGLDGWLADLVTEHTAALRDRAGLIAAAGSIEDLGSVYRGPAVALKRSRSGLLLSPQNQGDGDLFGIRPPRSTVGGPPVPGRGLLIRGGAFQGAQVVLPE
ncbi:MAG: ATP-binding protein, partial [Actinobacteria bacterium]|nr:ATP-binding protein [Actinomycetota bacterium]